MKKEKDMKRIKVLFMIPSLGSGGAEKVLVNLVNNLDKNKFDITLKTLFNDKCVNKQFLQSHVKYEFCFKKTFPANSQILKLFPKEYLYQKFVKDQYDIVVSYLEGPTARIISGCQNKETKKVCWIHVEQHTKEKASYAFRGYKEAFECYDSFDKIVCVSNTVKRDFYEIFENALKNDPIVLYNTNETDHILKISNEDINEIEYKNDCIKICGVGRLNKVKAFERLINIHHKLINEGYNINTFIFGEGKERTNLEYKIYELNLQNSFKLMGYTLNPYKYVKNSDLFVCCSTSEGFNTAATESLIVGTTVCTVEVSGMKEMLGENNEYGIVVENDDDALYKAIKELLDNPQLLTYYKEKAIERGKYFSTEKTVKAVEKMLVNL